ncbi:D-serine ammonia-lyase [Senegalia massiliensis]|uniref:D-serine ammonia-lyase n=1 Tax=Senegalia massiliensis TaxID=1720316 RepID=UPI0010319538|nr:D-serine ammonia-lyase [Senegalia massiliensis]
MDIIDRLKSLNETIWYNPNYMASPNMNDFSINIEEVKKAEARLLRFAPYIEKVFPETKDGIIESPINRIDKMKNKMENIFDTKIYGNLLLKRDDLLPIAGSIKARGGIYEVLKYVEELLLKQELLNINDDYRILTEEKFKNFFSKYTIQVGSTGNLGLSIGIMSAKIGFKVIVHMSSDAKKWKKDLLRSKGVKVVEYEDDYSIAVEEGRYLSNKNPKSYFIDDENSKNLFLGYAVGGMRVKKQLDDMGIIVDKENPLFVYLPCGVGGGPGGVAYGLKLVYGDNVKCFFAEPTHSPAMLLGLATGKHDKISVKDIGLDNKTEADGLAVGRPSLIASEIMDKLLTGSFTIEDKKLYIFLKALYKSEYIFLEPSALAGFLGPIFTSSKYKEENITHLCWGTGGSLVPKEVREKFLMI